MSVTPFHLAFPVRDLAETRAFYETVLGAKIGRSSETWVDFDLFGHQLSAHLRPGTAAASQATGQVDGHAVPIPHFGVVLAMADWDALAARLTAREDIVWIEKPMLRFRGEPGEQATLFLLDPSGNALEFKGFSDMAKVFAA